MSSYKQPKILCIPYTGECIPVLAEIATNA